MKSVKLWQNPNPRLVCSIPHSSVRSHNTSLTQHSLSCAVLGAGFAGLSVVWHLFKHSPKELNLKIDIYDEVGIGGGASGIAGGLLHPYSPKVKLLWEGAQCWKESMKLLRVAEEASVSKDCTIGESAQHMKPFVAQKS